MKHHVKIKIYCKSTDYRNMYRFYVSPKLHPKFSVLPVTLWRMLVIEPISVEAYKSKNKLLKINLKHFCSNSYLSQHLIYFVATILMLLVHRWLSSVSLAFEVLILRFILFWDGNYFEDFFHSWSSVNGGLKDVITYRNSQQYSFL